MADTIRQDFDRIAALPPDPARRWNHNDHYRRWLLDRLPVGSGAGMEAALDVGCGTGELSRILAARARRVVGIDLSPEMVRVARERSRSLPNVEYRVGDVASTELPSAAFDCIACVATLHHLPLEETLRRFAAALRPGGTLLALDLYRASTPLEWAACALAVPVSLAARLARNNGRLRSTSEAREAWAAHGAHDVYPTLEEVRRVCARCLPGARVRRHLYFRYSLVWRRPS